LDDQKTKRAQRARKGETDRAKAEPLDPSQANATVAEVFPNQCRVRLDEDGREVLCPYRRAGVVGASSADLRERSPVAVGDRVQVAQLTQSSGVVEGLCRRRNLLSRAAPGREPGQVRHVIAANIDLLAIVDSLHEPEFTPGLIDRYLVAAEAAGIPAMLIVSKSDLAHAGERPEDPYKSIGYPAHRQSAKKGEGIDELRALLTGKRVVFCGHSGVGKTSLLRILTGTEIGRVGEVSESKKGRHTTTSAILLPGTEWIDTPGVREFSLDGVKPDNLAAFFPEMRGLTCETPGCLHVEEPGCKARGLFRYPSYRSILDRMNEER
jgi:ribosome biogenesis GTPase